MYGGVTLVKTVTVAQPKLLSSCLLKDGDQVYDQSRLVTIFKATRVSEDDNKTLKNAISLT